jgi:hypothetical protein
MALDPNIILRGVQGFQQPDLGAAAQQGLETVGIFQKMRNEQELAPLRKSILEGQSAGLALANKKNEQALALQKENRDLVNLYSFYQRNKGRFERGEYEAIAQEADAVAQQRIDEGQSEADVSDTRMIADVMRGQDSEAITNLFQDGAALGDLLVQRGLLEEDPAVAAAAKERFSPTTVNLAGGVTVQTTSTGRKVVTDAEGNILKGQEAAKAIKAAERQEIESKIEIAKETTAARLGEQAKGVAAIEEEKVRGRVAGEAVTAPTVAKIKSAISVAVKNAEREAAKTGEKLSDLSRMRAALPGLQETVGKLRELAPIATHTLGGRLFDMAVKELGFGSTKGATARAKYISIIRNQVLPLLKPTFGGSFTVAEGDKLEATLGDPDSTPEEKLAQLDSFIENKVREIEATERELTDSQEPQASEFDPELLEFMTPEERALFNGAN